MTMPANFTAILARWEAARPDAVAITFGGTHRTWAELAHRVRRAAAALRAAGLAPGDRIAVLDLNHPSCLELTLACAQIGTANAVVNFRLAPPEIVYVINDAKARLLFVGPEFAGAAEKFRDHLPSVERVVRIGGADDQYEAWLAAHEPDARVHPTAPGDCFVQLYTSGTTGFPKGAMLTHRGMLAHSRNVSASQDFDPDSRVQVAMPLFHVGGTSYSLMAISLGARVFMMRMPDPAAALAMLEAERITHTFFVPALMAVMNQVPGAADRDYSALKALSYGASPMPLPVMRASLKLFPNVMQQVYGMTEQSGMVSLLGPGDHVDPAVAHRLISAGKPIPGMELKIVDPVTLDELPPGENGEIWLRTTQLMKGFLGKPEATAEVVRSDGWFRTGDMGKVDDEGFVFVEDRIKDMIISGGENIYSPEIERVLAEHPAVMEVAIIGVPDDRWGETVKAVVALKPDTTATDDELIAYCREHLAAYKCPTSVDILAALPRNPTGKILKRDLRKPYWEGRDRKVV